MNWTLLEILAQADQTPSSWEGILATFGPFAPFAILVLSILRILWNDNKEKDQEIRRLSNLAMEKTIPLVLESTRVLNDTTEILQKAGTQEETLKKVTEGQKVILDGLNYLLEEAGINPATGRKTRRRTQE